MQLTVRDVSEVLDVTESTVTRWIKQRGLPARHVGGQYRVQPGGAAGVGDGQPGQGVAGTVRSLRRRGRSRPGAGRGPRSRRDLLSAPGHQPGPSPPGAGGGAAAAGRRGSRTCCSVCSLRGKPRPRRRSAMASPSRTSGTPSSSTFPARWSRSCFLERPVDFGALDGKPVHVLFSIISPTHAEPLATALAARPSPCTTASSRLPWCRRLPARRSCGRSAGSKPVLTADCL